MHPYRITTRNLGKALTGSGAQLSIGGEYLKTTI
jgi:hypothetical protein